MSLLTLAREFIQERAVEERAGVRREKETFRSTVEKLEKVEWLRSLEAAYLLLLQCGKHPDSDILDAVAALLLFLSDPEEKVEKLEKVGGKPPTHYGLTRAEAQALLIRVCLGQRIRLGDDGLIKEVASEESAAA